MQAPNGTFQTYWLHQKYMVVLSRVLAALMRTMNGQPYDSRDVSAAKEYDQLLGGQARAIAEPTNPDGLLMFHRYVIYTYAELSGIILDEDTLMGAINDLMQLMWYLYDETQGVNLAQIDIAGFYLLFEQLAADVNRQFGERYPSTPGIR